MSPISIHMNLDEIDLLKISDAQAIKINSSLPKPNQEIVGHVSVLPVTIAMGCRITVLPEKKYLIHVLQMIPVMPHGTF